MELYEHSEQFKIKYCDVDFKDEIKISTVLSLMEEVASSSAEELGFGYSYVKPRGYAFMVCNICCEFLKPIVLGENVEVKTWPTPPTHVIFGREYQFFNAKKENAMNASSRWCLIDMNNEKLLQSKAIDNQDYTTYNTSKAIETPKWKIPVFQQTEGELKFTITIANSEYDHNMHVNNTRYAEYCLNCFSIAELKEKRLKKFSITYVKQCKENETLYFYRKRMADGGYLTHGFNESGQIVTQSQIYFEE